MLFAYRAFKYKIQFDSGNKAAIYKTLRFVWCIFAGFVVYRTERIGSVGSKREKCGLLNGSILSDTTFFIDKERYV